MLARKLKDLDEKYELLKKEKGVIDTRFHTDFNKDTPPDLEEFVDQANVILDAYISGSLTKIYLV